MSEYDQVAALNQGLPNLSLMELFGETMFCWIDFYAWNHY